MQLNEILETNSFDGISKKTNIAKDTLERLFVADFGALQKTKALGFISIIEREYHADLDSLRSEAQEYYAQHTEPQGKRTVGIPVVHQKRGKSKWLLILVFGLLVYVSWYFFTQFDKKHLKNILPFMENKISQEEATRDVKITDELSIETVIASVAKEEADKKNELSTVVPDETKVPDETNATQMP